MSEEMQDYESSRKSKELNAAQYLYSIWENGPEYQKLKRWITELTKISPELNFELLKADRLNQLSDPFNGDFQTLSRPVPVQGEKYNRFFICGQKLVTTESDQFPITALLNVRNLMNNEPPTSEVFTDIEFAAIHYLNFREAFLDCCLGYHIKRTEHFITNLTVADVERIANGFSFTTARDFFFFLHGLGLVDTIHKIMGTNEATGEVIQALANVTIGNGSKASTFRSEVSCRDKVIKTLTPTTRDNILNATRVLNDNSKLTLRSHLENEV